MRANNRKLGIVKSDGRTNKRRNGGARRTSARGLQGKRISYLDFGKQALRDINHIRKFVNTEVHSSDIDGTAGTACTSTPTFVLLNGLTTGDGNTNRTGQSIKGIKGQIHYAIPCNTTAVTNLVRIMVVRDKQPNGAIFAIGSLLNVTDTLSDYVIGGQNRFYPLLDKTYALSIGGPYIVVEDLSFSFNYHVEYNTGNTGTVTDINSESIYLVFFSNQAVNAPNFYYYNRLYFVDN